MIRAFVLLLVAWWLFCSDSEGRIVGDDDQPEPAERKSADKVEAQIRRAKAHDRDVKRDPYLRRDIAALGGDPSL